MHIIIVQNTLNNMIINILFNFIIFIFIDWVIDNIGDSIKCILDQ